MTILNYVVTAIMAMIGATAMTSLPARAATAPEPTAKSSGEKSPEAFNPARCKTGNKAYVYWAARDQVFRFKYNQDQPIYPLSAWKNVPRMHVEAEKEVPPAPNPKEPEGCYGNPMRAGPVPYLGQYAEVLSRKVLGHSIRHDTPKRGLGDGYFAVATYLSSFNTQASQEKKFLAIANCWQRDTGIHECLISKGSDRSDYSINRIIKIDMKQLPEKTLINKIYFYILAEVLTDRSILDNGVAVETGFDVFGSVRFDLGFRIFPEEIDKLPVYCDGLIKYLINGYVSDYIWIKNGSKS